MHYLVGSNNEKLHDFLALLTMFWPNELKLILLTDINKSKFDSKDVNNQIIGYV